MRAQLLTTFLGLSMNAYAANPPGSVQIDMSLNLNGEVSNPKVITNFGQTATITQTSTEGPKDGFEITVTPTRKDEGLILLTMKISEIKDGQKKLVSSPKVAVSSGKSAGIRQEASDGDRLELSVTPTAL